MEEIKITEYEYKDDPDLGELYMILNGDTTRSGTLWPVDDERYFLLKVNRETSKIVGAVIFHANDWFAEIADAFQRKDLNHPDVRFFMEHKLREFAQQLHHEMQANRKITEQASADSPKETHVAPTR